MFQLPPPVMSIRVVYSGKVYRYPLDPEATCGSIKRRFANDSGLELSEFRLKVKTPGRPGTLNDDNYVLVDAELLDQLLEKLARLGQRRDNHFELRMQSDEQTRTERRWDEVREVLRDPSMNRIQANQALASNFSNAVDRGALTRRVERIFDETMQSVEREQQIRAALNQQPWELRLNHPSVRARGVVAAEAALGQAAVDAVTRAAARAAARVAAGAVGGAAAPGRDRNPRAGAGAGATASVLRSDEEDVILELRVIDTCFPVEFQPIGVVTTSGQMCCTYSLANGCALGCKIRDTVGDLRTRLAQRLQTQVSRLVLRVAGEEAPIKADEDSVLLREHRLSSGRCLDVERRGYGQVEVIFDERTLKKLTISFEWSLEQLVEEIRKCAPALAGVQFHLRTNGLILAGRLDTPVGRLYLGDFALQVVVDIDDKLPARKTAATGDTTPARIERMVDMNEFLCLQSETFLDQHANVLGRMRLLDYINGVAAEVMRNRVPTEVLPRPPSPTPIQPPTASPESVSKSSGKAANRSGTQVTVDLAVPRRAVRFMKVRMFQPSTGREFVLDRVTPTMRLHTLRERLEGITGEEAEMQRLSIDRRLLIDDDLTLRELGVLHGARLLLEQEEESEYDSSDDDDDDDDD